MRIRRRDSHTDLSASGYAPAIRPMFKWERERATKLNRRFRKWEVSLAAGVSLHVLAKRALRRGRDYYWASDRTKKRMLAKATYYRWFRRWQMGGRTPEALRMGYQGRKSTVPVPVVCRFVDFCASVEFPNLPAALAAFVSREWVSPAGARQLARQSYYLRQFWFPGRQFERLRSAHRARRRAERELAAIRDEILTKVRQRMPGQEVAI